MKKLLLTATLLSTLCPVMSYAQTEDKPSNIYIKYNDDRFTSEDSISLDGVDSVEFTKTSIRRYKYSPTTGRTTKLSSSYVTGATYSLNTPERHLAKPGQYSNIDYTKASSKWSFTRSMESEHFICFWENGISKSGNTVSYGGYSVNIKNLLTNAEKIFDIYVNQLGFLEPGKSVTDRTKIHMYIVKTSWDGSDWRADGSGEDGIEFYMNSGKLQQRSRKVALFHCTTRAADARGGHTPAHEIGHSFQYLVSADLGQSHGLNYGFGPNASGGNAWWEDCANWQAYKVYPERQFTDGEYYEQYMTKHHQNILHEDSRYTNCFYHDYWCMKHGMNTIGRVWRESIKPEDPVEAYMRIFGLNTETFADEMYEGFARMASWDIDGVRDRAKHRIGTFPQRLIEPSDQLAAEKLNGNAKYWWTVSPSFCPQNYGANINELKIPAAGTKITATFRGIAGATGFRKVKVSEAGWRYGFVAYTTKGERIYSPVQSNSEDGTAEITVPENCANLWFVVMGAPKSYWRHPWDDDVTNDEQWPYAVHFDGTSPLGTNRHYDEFPEDYERKDTTVVINTRLTQSSSQYSYVHIQYDMDAISEALGLSTEQLKSVKRNDTKSDPGDIRYAGVNKSGTLKFETTTTDSNNTRYGYWFNVGGTVCGYDSSAAIYANFFPNNYGCDVGQYPGRLSKGRTYTIRQAIVYTHTDGKEYKAVMEINVAVQ